MIPDIPANNGIEEWRAVASSPAYDVSNLGRVRRGSRIKKPTLARNGYLVVNLGHNDVRYVHRLVCDAFCERPTETHSEVAHWDGAKTNNRDSNLRWVTGKENSADTIRHGRTNRGIRAKNAVLTEADVRMIRATLAAGVSQAEAARRMGIAPWLVWDIAQRKTWAWLE